MSSEEASHPEQNDSETMEGWVPALARPEELFEALEKAFDYRGDITLTLRDGEQVEGYIFDRRTGKGLDDSFVRLFPKGSEDRRSICYADIERLEFTGRDTAAGKSWETWLKKYSEKKARGEKANLYGENLDES